MSFVCKTLTILVLILGAIPADSQEPVDRFELAIATAYRQLGWCDEGGTFPYGNMPVCILKRIATRLAERHTAADLDYLKARAQSANGLAPQLAAACLGQIAHTNPDALVAMDELVRSGNGAILAATTFLPIESRRVLVRGWCSDWKTHEGLRAVFLENRKWLFDELGMIGVSSDIDLIADLEVEFATLPPRGFGGFGESLDETAERTRTAILFRTESEITDQQSQREAWLAAILSQAGSNLSGHISQIAGIWLTAQMINRSLSGSVSNDEIAAFIDGTIPYASELHVMGAIALLGVRDATEYVESFERWKSDPELRSFIETVERAMGIPE